MVEIASGTDFLDELVHTRNLIIEKFSLLHSRLRERESQLLTQLHEIEQWYRERDRRAEELQQLLLIKEQTYYNLKENQHVSTLREMVLPLEARIRELDVEKLETINLEWNGELEMEIQWAGAINLNGRRSVIDHYKSKSNPVHAFGRHKTNSSKPGEFMFPNAIAFDHQTKRIYVCDGGNDRVQVFDNSGGFLFAFNEGMMTPVGICIFANRVYVTQMLGHALNVYGTDGILLQSFRRDQSDNLQLNYPKGLSVSNVTENIYICDSKNGRIVVLNQILKLVCLIQCNSFPDDIKTTENEIFVLTLSNPCVLIYNYAHQFVHSVISYGLGKQIVESYNIFIDQKCNILMTDTTAHCVLVFSRNGHLIHKFGGVGDSLERMFKPRGISMDSDGRIIIASQNPNYPIQLF